VNVWWRTKSLRKVRIESSSPSTAAPTWLWPCWTPSMPIGHEETLAPCTFIIVLRTGVLSPLAGLKLCRINNLPAPSLIVPRIAGTPGPVPLSGPRAFLKPRTKFPISEPKDAARIRRSGFPRSRSSGLPPIHAARNPFVPIHFAQSLEFLRPPSGQRPELVLN